MRLSALAVLCGSVLVAFGMWLAWPPLLPITSGAVLAAWGLLRSTDAAD